MTDSLNKSSLKLFDLPIFENKFFYDNGRFFIDTYRDKLGGLSSELKIKNSGQHTLCHR